MLKSLPVRHFGHFVMSIFQRSAVRRHSNKQQQQQQWDKHTLNFIYEMTKLTLTIICPPLASDCMLNGKSFCQTIANEWKLKCYKNTIYDTHNVGRHLRGEKNEDCKPQRNIFFLFFYHNLIIPLKNPLQWNNKH